MTKRKKSVSFLVLDAQFPSVIHLKKTAKDNASMLLPDGGKTHKALMFHFAHNGAYFSEERYMHAIPVLREQDNVEGFLWAGISGDPLVLFEPRKLPKGADKKPTKDAIWHEAANFVYSIMMTQWQEADAQMKEGTLSYITQLVHLGRMPWKHLFASIDFKRRIVENEDGSKRGVQVDHVDLTMPDGSALRLTADGPQPLAGGRPLIEVTAVEFAYMPTADEMRKLTTEDFLILPVVNDLRC